MPNARANRAPAEGGFVMIEVLVSALVILIVAGAVLSLMTATTRSAADQRQKAAAYSLAQEDQARLRTMRLSTLNRNETRQVPLDGTTYTVNSTGHFVNNSTGDDSSCDAANSVADYARITSKVSWDGGDKSVFLSSVVSPSSGSLQPEYGSLLITATNINEQKLAGVGISGTGAGTFSGNTDANGCANFSDLPVGNYSVTMSAPGFVDLNGRPSPWTETMGVKNAQSTRVNLTYDRPGTIETRFSYREGSSYLPATADSIWFSNELMPNRPQLIEAAGGARMSMITIAPVFPYPHPTSLFTGYCSTANKPESEVGFASATVPANGVVQATIQMPALFLTVKRGGVLTGGARVTLTDEVCKKGSTNVKRLFTTDANGRLTEPGQPSGTYKICASSGNRFRTESGVAVKNYTSGKTVTMDIPTSGTGSSGAGSWGSGECSWP